LPIDWLGDGLQRFDTTGTRKVINTTDQLENKNNNAVTPLVLQAQATACWVAAACRQS
jgi:hypothetical protein